MRKSLALALCSAVWVVVTTGVAHASCVVPPPIEQAIEDADVVFVGTVVDLGADERQAIVEVESVWKGEGVATLVSVDGGIDPNGATSVDRYFEFGRYIFFPTTREFPFRDTACTSTQLVTAEIEALEPSTAEPPIDGEAVALGPFGKGSGEEFPAPPEREVPVGPGPLPLVLNPGTVFIEEPEIGLEPETRALAGSPGGGEVDSYLFPMLVVGGVVVAGLGGAALVRRHRNDPIE